jgi:hypothetical protein
VPTYRQILGTVKQRASSDPFLKDADLYRSALEKAAYGSVGPQYAEQLGTLQNYLAGAGPLADSGARTVLGSKLAAQMYGAASGRIQSGYADYLARALQARQQYNYQRQLLKYQQKLQKTGLGGIIGGIAGTALGGPLGGAIGRRIAGGGGGSNYASDAYYG